MERRYRPTTFGELSDITKKMYLRLYNKYGTSLLASRDPEAYLDALKINVITKRQLVTAMKYLTPNQSEKQKELFQRLLIKYREKEREGEGHVPVVQDYETIKPQRELKSTVDQIIYYLFTKQVPRRAQDYVNMYIWKKLGLPKDNTKNWYVSRKQLFIFNKYKTSKLYGQQIIKVDDDLQKVLIKHINLKRPVTNILARKDYESIYKSGDKLFQLKQSGFSSKVKRLIGLTINQIRHSYVDYYHKKNPHASNNELTKFAGSMQHTVLCNLQYRTQGLVNRKK